MSLFSLIVAVSYSIPGMIFVFCLGHFFTTSSFLCTIPGVVLDFWLGLFFRDLLCIPRVLLSLSCFFSCFIAGVHLVGNVMLPSIVS